jgi:transcriptional regulator with XRE-family HTH domain
LQRVLQSLFGKGVDTMSLGGRIRELRLARGWSQDDLAKRAGISRGYVSLLEREKPVRIVAEKVSALATALGVPKDSLLEAGGFIESPTTDQDLLDPELRLYMAQIGLLSKRDQRVILRLIREIIEAEREEHGVS